MKSKTSLRQFLLAGSSLLAISSASAQTTYTWANSNVNGATPAGALDWFTGGSNTQATWTGGSPVSNDLNTIQFFQNTTTASPNTAAATQASVLNNGGTAFQLGTLTLSGRGSATANANLTMNISGDALNFSAATGTINLDALNNTRTITYNVANHIRLGTAADLDLETPGSASVLTFQGNGTSAFNFAGNITELNAGGGSVVKSGSSTVTLSGTNTYSGGTSISQGSIWLGTANVVGSGNHALGTGTLTFSGNSEIRSAYASYSIMANAVEINSGVSATLCAELSKALLIR